MKALVAALKLGFGLGWGLSLVTPVLADVRDEVLVVGDNQVAITVSDTLEILTVGPQEGGRVEILSGADIEIVAMTEDPASSDLVGALVLVAEVTGTHSCETGDARLYYVVRLDAAPAAEGPVSTCAALTVSLTPGAVVLEADPMGEDGAFWAWAPDKGWASQLP